MTDTKMIVLSIIGTGIATITVTVGFVAIITGGTNNRIEDLRADMNARFADLRTDINTRFAEAAAERRDEHRRIDDRLDRLEDILLKPASPADQ